MIPSVISSQVQRGIEDFLKTTFPPSNPFFHGILERLFADREQLFKGPYLSAKLPFRTGTIKRNFFSSFEMQYTPYLHQEKAFKRLSGATPQATIVSTGTGSGKTECFLYPVLDYCWHHRGEPGIKVIIIYPMNALANDQAKRIAEMIAGNDKLKGLVTAGLFVGASSDDKGQMMMTDEMVITHKDGMRASPPDILLTNYKMLDYLMIRPVDFPLWKENGTESLKYMIVDELHTFDGAQGTDLGCLIRRVKERVKTPENYLCCIGTSATLGGKDDLTELRQYASDLFGERFDDDSVITEDLLGPAEFFGNSFITRSGAVDATQQAALDPDAYNGYRDYVAGQYKLWFGMDIDESKNGWKTDLADELMQHAFFRNLILVLNNQTLSLSEISTRIQKIEPTLKGADPEFVELVVNSMLALVSSARLQLGEKLSPFLNVRVQFWMRELRRIVSSVSSPPKLRFSDDLRVDELKNHLPPIHCRACGAMGWAAVKRQHDDAFDADLQKFYQAFFNYSPTVHFIFPEAEVRLGEQMTFGKYICGSCLYEGTGELPSQCPSCGMNHTLIKVDIYNPRIKKRDRVESSHDCPYCQSHESLTILGSRAASLLAVVIGQLFNSTYYEAGDKKLLAFSDSVQDASHRAGFFEARTFGFNFRTALQKVLQSSSRSLSLKQLPAAFISYWKEQLALPDYVATFLAPNMAWFEDYERLMTEGRLPDGSTLVDDMEKRIGWEVLSEFGFRSRIGRTLEKSGCSIAYADPERLNAVAGKLTEQMRNEIGGWTALSKADVLRFLMGVITQLRTGGAISTQVLDGYVASWGGYYMLSKQQFLPNFGKRSRTPVLLTTKSGTRFDALLSSGTGESWYEFWLSRVLGPFNPQIGAFADTAYRLTLDLLTSSGVVKKIASLSHPVWTLEPDGLLISREVDQYCCDFCGFQASAAAEDRDSWEGLSCRRFRCTGHYVRQLDIDDYYGKLYSRGEVHRIFADEHTGLLERVKRESLENRFIHQNAPASPNILSCTPTLEMGINIGELSTVLLCSVPPSQSSYLQRVGRAGRRDGNAFNFTMAEGRPHDLYFFAEPIEMLAGTVATPGIFLNAPAVLERQFVGFCFDRWVEQGVKPEALPRKVGQVLTNLSLGQAKGLFPYNLLTFIDTHRTVLLSRFLELFASALSDASRALLTAFVEGSGSDETSLVYKVTNRLCGLARDRDDLKKRVQRVNKVIKSKEASGAKDKNTEEDLAKLHLEKSALNRIIRNLNDKDTFNFFTDEGLLPNYAFPEAGVLLRSIIYRKKKIADGRSAYDTQILEYERPAASAIQELAPANTFYAEKRKVQIDRINLELSEVEVWRFCNQCSYAVKDFLNTSTKTCPKCDSPMWADDSQKRSMVLLRQVEATTSDRDSRVDDSSENREPLFYNKQMLVDIDKQFVEKAFRLKGDDIPFGFEFLRKADFKEVNFGEKTGVGETIQIAGHEVPAQGFVLCKSCGKIKIGNGHDFKHALTCRYHGKEEDSQFMDFLYLYRQFSSEALRILLPVTSFGVTVKLHSFIAALYLGLKEKFKGNIDHLQTTIVEDPVPDSDIKKQYLVLYDRVPGGTGYLKELAKSEEAMIELLELALHVLSSCECQKNPEKDGCYHCLYAFRTSRDLADISRTEAMNMLTAILDRKDELEEIDSVDDIDINMLFDSELEAQFIEALRRMKPGGEPVQLTKDVVNGKPGWYLQLSNGAYRIEPQVSVTEADGVSIPSKPDFVFYPERSDQGLPIAVFTDGYTYHADVNADNLRVGYDMAQRMALLRSGKFRVWSLTWQDVETQFNKTDNKYFVNIAAGGSVGLQNLLSAYDDNYKSKRLSGMLAFNAFEGLMTYLSTPDLKLWKLYAFAVAISYQKMHIAYCSEDAADRAIRAVLAEKKWDSLVFPQIVSGDNEPWFSGNRRLDDEAGRPQVAMATYGRRAVLRPETYYECRVALRLFDDQDIAESEGFKACWNGFLHLSNLLQFLPRVDFVTTRGLLEHMYSALPDFAPYEERSSSASPLEAEYDELYDLTDVKVHALLKHLMKIGKAAPVPGFELEGTHKEVVATAELAWPEVKLAVVLDYEVDSAPFIADHWIVHSLTDFESDLETYLKKVPEYTA